MVISNNFEKYQSINRNRMEGPLIKKIHHYKHLDLLYNNPNIHLFVTPLLLLRMSQAQFIVIK